MKNEIIILVFTLSTIFTIGCNKITNVNDDPNYAQLLNKEYSLLVDTLLYKPKGSLEYKIGIPGEYLPEIKDLQELPYYYEGVTILKIIPKKTVLKITDILKEYRPMSGTYYHIKSKLVDKPAFQNITVDIINLTDLLNDHRSMDEKYLKEVLVEGEAQDEANH